MSPGGVEFILLRQLGFAASSFILLRWIRHADGCEWAFL
jgi:hypothetical protein